MSVFTKMLGAATKLTQSGRPAEATQVLRDGLAELAGRPVARKQTPPTAEQDDHAPFPCFGTPSAFDFSKGWAGLVRPSGLKPSPAPTRGETTGSDRFQARSFSGPSGTRAYKLFVPDSAAAPRGLILMLHGCSQNPDDFAAGTRMNEVAQRNNVLVAYPEQSRSANPSLCWNWFEPKDQTRDAGEPAILAGIAREIAAEFGVRGSNIFVAGLSAGGAMAAILAETYPDVFAGVGIHSGLPYGSAHDVSSALTSMKGVFVHGSSVQAETSQQAEVLARGIPAIVFHGDADRTVHRSNADAIVARIEAREAGLAAETESGTAADGRRYLRTVGRDGSGAVRFEHWTLIGAGHAWSGGSQAGSYADPTGPDASAEMMRFFLAQTAET